MINYTKYNKGSEWRKWDLHFHAPTKFTCAKNDQYIGNSLVEKQEKFIEELKAVSDISVIGITDYFSMDGYKLVLSKQADLKNYDLILPNIELRITPVTGDNRKINLHIIPNTTILKIDEIEKFLYKFEFGPEKYTCKQDDLVSLGKKLNPTSSDEEAFKRGLNEFHISYDKFFEVYNNLPDRLKYNILIGVSNNSGDGASGIKDIQGIRDVIYSGIHFIFSAQPADRDYFLGKGPDSEDTIIQKYGGLKPCIHGSDYHGSKDGKTICVPDLNRFCWIKADPSFEGLRQIVYEPEDRVKIQASLPEDKAGYQIIDKIEISNPLKYNQSIEFNPNLNSIIGGRSTGKSILLGAISKKLKPVRPIQYHDVDYDAFVQTIASSIRVIWKDAKEENNREIEFFQQGYMHEIARDEYKLSKIIQDILNQKGKESILTGYNKSISETSRTISGFISDFFQVVNNISDKAQKILDKGDKNGIEDEIKRLSSELSGLTTTSISTEEKEEYDRLKGEINALNQTKATIASDIQNIEVLKITSLFKETISYETTSISEERRNQIDTLFNELKQDASKKWIEKLDELISKARESEASVQGQLELATNNETYIKVSKAYSNDLQLTEYEQKIQVQKNKLFEITGLLEEVEILKKQRDGLKDSIINAHKSFYQKTIDVVSQLSDTNDGLDIKAKPRFNEDQYRQILQSSINQQSYENQALSNFKYVNNEGYEAHIFDLFNELVYDQVTLKGGYNNQTLINTLMSKSFYNLNYDLEYEGDDFKRMSDGKKAFVVLKLLLDFSNKDCPILIDQPEDDLDNRAIYNDLVKYLRKKKKLRQIIVATHNPNIVVGADSELVICANQHGDKSPNRDDKKFQYVSGSLEHTFENNGNKEILEAQGIREHVCEVLEGGNIAFKLREMKYAIK